MATAAEVAQVRLNTNEATEDTYTDEAIEELIDAGGVEYASATIWEHKASMYVTSVDVTEAGASHKFSDLFKNASAMAKYWRDRMPVDDAADTSGHPRVKKIVRS